MHGGDRNRTSPFAFTGNKFEFRALGSSMSLAFPNTVLNTIVAEAIDDLADKIEKRVSSGDSLEEAVKAVVKDSWSQNKQIVFGGDNYDEAWHAEAVKRGLKNLRTTPDALPEVISDQTVAAFDNYHVLSERELESRYEVWLEQYVVNANIEAETAHDIAKTMIMPATLRYLATIDAAQVAETGIGGQTKGLVVELANAINKLETANSYPEGVEGMELAEYARDNQLTAMADVREVVDRLEKVVADDLWPLPKYSEILFVR
jgi:glutamine synthetase